jgi:hypothetical protein
LHSRRAGCWQSAECAASSSLSCTPQNNLAATQQNLTDAIALLDDAKAAAAATAAATEFMEFLGSMDYNTYFDQRMGREPPSGAQQAAFVDFSMKAQRAAQAKLAFILAAFDGEQMAAARQQTESAAML